MYELLFGCRPFENFAPYSMIVYSKIAYLPMWTFFLSQLEWTKPVSMIDINTAASTISTNHINSNINSNINLNTNSNSNEKCSDHFFQLNKILSEIDAAPFYPDLVCDILDLLSVGEPLSKEGREMLLSLLEVRIHKRLGVGEKYNEFTNHCWFEKINICNIPSSLQTLPSPIQIDLDYVNEHIHRNYSKFDNFSTTQIQQYQHHHQQQQKKEDGNNNENNEHAEYEYYKYQYHQHEYNENDENDEIKINFDEYDLPYYSPIQP